MSCLTVRTANVYIFFHPQTLYVSWSWHRFIMSDVHIRSMTGWILVLQVLLTYANVCPLFTLQFCSLLHFRRSIAFGPAFSTPTHWCRVFHPCIFDGAEFSVLAFSVAASKLQLAKVFFAFFETPSMYLLQHSVDRPYRTDATTSIFAELMMYRRLLHIISPAKIEVVASLL